MEIFRTKATRPSCKYWQPSPSLMPIISAQNINRAQRQHRQQQQQSGEKKREKSRQEPLLAAWEQFINHTPCWRSLVSQSACFCWCESRCVCVAGCVLIKPSINLRLLASNVSVKTKKIKSSPRTSKAGNGSSTERERKRERGGQRQRRSSAMPKGGWENALMMPSSTTSPSTPDTGDTVWA